MKKLFILTGCLIVNFTAFTQELPEMLSSGTISTENVSGSMLITIGEPAIGLIGTDQSAGVGFDYLLTKLDNETTESDDFEFSSLPNPFDNEINVNIEDATRNLFLIRIISDNGRIIDEQNEPNQFKLDLGYLSAGIYGLLIHDINTKQLLGKRKIVKR